MDDFSCYVTFLLYSKAPSSVNVHLISNTAMWLGCELPYPFRAFHVLCSQINNGKKEQWRENRMLVVLLCVAMNCCNISIKKKYDSIYQKGYVASPIFIKTLQWVLLC